MQLPVKLIESLKDVKGFDQSSFERIHQSAEQVTAVRINPAKATTDTLDLIQHSNKVPWSSNGYYLDERPLFTVDPLFHAGAYYVQDASSMFLEEAIIQTVDITQQLKVLDLCAAPGGKSTLIQSLISKESLLVSNEVIKTRVNILSENISKWGPANVIVTNNDPKDFERLTDYFDLIVVDAPCSGSGLFRKDPEAIEEWSEHNVELCSQRQQRILANIFSSLKDSGTLIYSTCSYSTKEDEEIGDWLIENFALQSQQLKTGAAWNIVETQSEKHNAYGYRFYPDQLKGEGFFIAAFTKTGSADYNDRKQTKPKKVQEKLTAKEVDIIKPYLKDPTDFFFIKQNEEVLAIPSAVENELAAIQSALYIKKAGVKLGIIIRNELIPDHELAVSNIINANTLPVEADEFTALQYLRKQEIKIDIDKKGWTLITYKNLPLGWVKVLPGRINNYYPKEWRILNK